jgi:threonyl-tRNA synthetase
VLPISEKHSEYAKSVHARLRAAGLRAHLDDRNGKLGYRIREAQVQKVPYMLVVGEREAQQGTASLRQRGSEQSAVLPVDQIVHDLVSEVGSRSATLTVGRSG